MKGKIIVIAALLFLSGCASTLRQEVTAFGAPPIPCNANNCGKKSF